MTAGQVASDWLFSCPEDVLKKLLHGSGPGTPMRRVDLPDDAPVLKPRRVTLQAPPAPPLLFTADVSSACSSTVLSCCCGPQYYSTLFLVASSNRREAGTSACCTFRSK